MPQYPFGKRKIIDELQHSLDQVEKTWPMTGCYERIEPYIIPYFHGREYFELLIYHAESKRWFDNFQTETIMDSIADKELVVAGDVAFDLGSNAGAYTVFLAKLCGQSGHVHAFDPYPWNALATQCNARINYCDNVTSHAVGVANRNYEINVAPNDCRTYESTSETNCQTLTIRSINEFMHLRPTFMKIDIEGSEYDVFDGQGPHVFETVRAFVLELHPTLIRSRDLDPKDVLSSMEKAGFALHYHSFEQPTYNVDAYHDHHGLFWARRISAER